MNEAASCVKIKQMPVILLLVSLFFSFFQAPAFATTIRDNSVSSTLAASDDGYASGISLGFGVNFLGHINTSLNVVNNGNIQFNGTPPANFDPSGLTAVNNRQIIAPFFADVDTRSGNIATYGATTINGKSAFIVNWPGVGYYNQHTDKLNNFQLVLIDRSDVGDGSFDIEFNYQNIQWDTGDGSGFSSRAGFSDGTQAAGTYYLINGSAVNSAFLDSNLTTGLIYASNIGMPGRFLFLARNGAIITDPIVLLSIANTHYQSSVAGVLDNLQSSVGGNFDAAIEQIKNIPSDNQKRQAVERIGVSFMSAFADISFKLASNFGDHINLHLDNLRTVSKRDQDNSMSGPKAKTQFLSSWSSSSPNNILENLGRFLIDNGISETSFLLADTLSFFTLGSGDFGKFKQTENQIDARYTGFNMTSGVEYRPNEKLSAGAAFGYSSIGSSFGDLRGHMDTTGYTGAIYCSSTIFEKGYIDALFGYSNIFFNYLRNINVGGLNQVAHGSPSAGQYSFKLKGGYDFQSGKIYWGPVMQLQYLDLRMPSYTEDGAGNLSSVVKSQTARSLTTDLGFRAFTKAKTRWGTFWPEAHCLLEYESKDDSRQVITGFSGVANSFYDTPLDRPDRTYARLGLALSGIFAKNIIFSIGYDTILANRHTSDQRATGSLSLQF